MAARSPAKGAGAGDADVVVVAAAVAAAAASCCDHAATVVECRDLSIASVPPAARGALDERRLVGTDVSDLSTLACARAGTVGVTLRTKKGKTEH
jgi:hypothetical protein